MRAHTSGSFAVFSRDDGKNVTPRGRKCRALLAYLISDAGSAVPKGRIVGLLWGDRAERQARSSLRQTLLELRTSINTTREIVCGDRDHVWVRPDTLIEDPGDASSDYKEAFQDLDGITPEFDDWLTAERSRRSKRRTAALKAEAEALLRAGRGDESLVLVEQMQAIDPHDEDALRLGMEAEFERGHPAAIVERFRAMSSLLFKDLGVEPSEETRRLRDQLIRRLTVSHRNRPLRESDQEYLDRRAREEREAAAKAQTQAAQTVHEILASRYADMALPLTPSTREPKEFNELRTSARMRRYFRNSLVVQAVQWFKPGDHPAVIVGSGAEAVGYIDTPEGRLRVDVADWIITGIAGENYPCKPDIFHQLYTPED